MSELLENFKERIEATIKNFYVDNSAIKLLHYRMNEPVSEETFKKVEEKLGFPLHPLLREFYSQCNGFSLRAYKVKPEIEKSEIEFGKTGSSEFIDWGDFCNDNKIWKWLGDDFDRKNGNIFHLYIRPIEDVFLGEQYLINEYDESNKHLYLFDAWYSYYPVAISANPQTKEFKVFIGSDYGACYTDYKPIELEDYFFTVMDGWYHSRYFSGYFFNAFNVEE